MFRNQRMNFDLPDSDMPFSTKASRKRESLVAEGNSFHDAFHRGDFDRSFQHLSPRGPAGKHPVLSGSHRRDPPSPYANNSLVSSGIMPMNHLVHGETGCNLRYSTFERGPSNVNSRSQGAFVSRSSRRSPQDIKTQIEPAQLHSFSGVKLGYNDQNISYRDRYHVAQTSHIGIDSKHGRNGTVESSETSIAYVHKPSMGPHAEVFANDYPKSGYRNITQEKDVERSEVEKGKQGSYSLTSLGISEPSTSPMRTSFGYVEEDNVMYRNLRIGARAENECSQSNLGDVVKNTKAIVQILAPTDSSKFEMTCLHGNTKDLTCSEANMVDDINNLRTDNQIQSIITGNLVKFTNDSRMDVQTKVSNARTSSVVPDKIWDGLLQLNNSIRVSATAFFKSGEKILDIKWSALVEVKGKVRLPAFEKFIGELPRSRTRTLMIISLCWNPCSSRAGLKGIKEIAQGYKQSEKVGVAKIYPGIDLYVCPRSKAITSILEKYGFLNGLTATEDQDSLIGCVVWRRSSQPSNSDNKLLEKTEASLVDQTVHSPEPSMLEVNTSATKKQELPSKQATISLSESDLAPCQPMSEASSISDNIDGLITEAKNNITSKAICTDDSSKLIYGPWSTHSFLYSTPLVRDGVVSQKNSECSSFDGTNKLNKGTQQSEDTTKPDLISSNPVPVINQLFHPFSATISNNFTYLGDSYNGATPLAVPPLPVNPPLPPVIPPFKLKEEESSTFISTKPSSNNGLNDGIQMIHDNESIESSERSHINQIPPPGPAPLPPDNQQKMVKSQKYMVKDIPGKGPCPAIAAASVANVKDNDLSVRRVATGATCSGLGTPGPFAWQPQLIVGSVTSRDIDDLPEFDFVAEVGSANRISPKPNPDIPKCKDHHVADLSKTQRLGKSNTSVSAEASSILCESVKTCHGIGASTSTEKPLSQNKSMVQDSQPQLQPSSVNSCTSKNRWDDDDDMPEWCPPVQEFDDHLQVARSTNDTSLDQLNLRFSVPQRSVPSPSRSYFTPPQIQGSFGGKPRILGRSDVGYTQHAPNKKAPLVGPLNSLRKPRSPPDANQSSKHYSSERERRPLNSYKKMRRY